MVYHNFPHKKLSFTLDEETSTLLLSRMKTFSYDNQEFARAIGVSATYCSRLMRGKTPLPYYIAQKISEVLQLELSSIPGFPITCTIQTKTQNTAELIIADAWDTICLKYFDNLKIIYMKLDLIKKQAMVGDLEKMIYTYSQKES